MAATRYIAAGATTLGTVTDGDDVYVLGGSAPIVTNVDQSALATGLASMDVGNEFNGSLGTSSSPLKAVIPTGTFWYNAQGGDSYWDSDGVTDVSAKLVMPKGTGAHMHAVGSVGTITSAEIFSGSFTISTGVTVTNLYAGSGADIRFYDDGSTDPTLIKQTGGVVYLDRGATTIDMSGGSLWVQGVNANAITTLTITGGLVHLVESGTITTINCWNSVPCTRKLIRPLTISNTNINMGLPGAEDFLNNTLITHSSVTKYMGR